MMLGVRPYPLLQESLTQYLLRLAYLNGYFKISELLIVIGMVRPKKSRFGIWSASQLKNLDEVLSTALNRPTLSVIEIDLRNTDKLWLNDKNRLLEELVVDFPRICHQCISEKKEFDWRWSLASTGRCVEHLSPLLDCCPHCGKSFDWDANIFEFCPSCRFKWVDIPVSDWDSVPLSPLEVQLWPQSNGKVSARESLLNDLCLAMHCVARPCDILHQSFNRVPKVTNHYLIVLHALQLLECPAYFNRWSQQLLDFWEEFSALLNPVNECNMHFSTVHGDGPNWELGLHPALNEYIRPARMAYVNKLSDEQPEFHIDIKLLCKAFGIAISDGRILIESGGLPQVNRTFNNNGNVISNKIFNIKDTATYLVKTHCKKIPKQAEFSVIEHDNELLKQHLCKYGELLSAVLKGDVIGRINQPTSLSSIQVDKESYIKWLTEQFDSATSTPIQIQDAALALGVDGAGIEVLVSNRQFYWAKWRKGSEFIDPDSFRDYVTKQRSII